MSQVQRRCRKQWQISLVFILLFGLLNFAYACAELTCTTAQVCVDGHCQTQQVCWLEENAPICDVGGDPADPGVPPDGGPGDTGPVSYGDADADGVLDCWRDVTLAPSVPPATGPYGQLAGRFHYGVDITSGGANYGIGSPVLAIATGTVAQAGYTEANGNYVKINHDDGRASYYLHLQGIDHTVTVGTLTVPGRMVGTMNCTGNCYGGGIRGADQGTHLHLEVRTSHTALRAEDGSTTIDPTEYSGTCP